jgi:hypothetical protein
MRLRAFLFSGLCVAGMAASGAGCGTPASDACSGGSTPTISADVACQIASATQPNYLDPACMAACNAGHAATTCTLPDDFLRAYQTLNPDAGGASSGGAGEAGSPEGGAGAPRCPASPAQVAIVCSPYCA